MRTLLLCVFLLVASTLSAEKSLHEILCARIEQSGVEVTPREIDRYCTWEEGWLNWREFRLRVNQLQDPSLIRQLQRFEERVRSQQRQRAQWNIALWKLGQELYRDYGGRVILLRQCHPLSYVDEHGLSHEQKCMCIGRSRCIEIPIPLEALHLYLDAIGETEADFNLEATLEVLIESGAARLARPSDKVFTRPYWI